MTENAIWFHKFCNFIFTDVVLTMNFMLIYNSTSDTVTKTIEFDYTIEFFKQVPPHFPIMTTM